MHLLHIHRDRDWQSDGVHAYYECACGARRVRRVSRNWYAPIPADWPRLLDRHGLPVTDSGWRKVTPAP